MKRMFSKNRGTRRTTKEGVFEDKEDEEDVFEPS